MFNFLLLQLKTLFLKHKTVFIITVLCLSACNIAFLYSTEMLYKMAYSNADVYYGVDVGGRTFAQLKGALSEDNFKNCYDVCVLFDGGAVTYVKGAPALLYGENADESGQILAGNIPGAQSLIGTEVELSGNIYTVTGAVSSDYAFVLPFGYAEEDLTVQSVRVRSLDFAGSAKIIKELKALFDTDAVKKAGELSLTNDFLNNPVTLLLAAVDLLSLAGIVLSVVYILNSSLKFLKILGAMGMSLNKCVDLCILLMGVLLAAVCLAGGLVFGILDAAGVWSVGQTAGMATYSLRFTDYVLTDIIMIFAAFAIYLPFAGQMEVKLKKVVKYD